VVVVVVDREDDEVLTWILAAVLPMEMKSSMVLAI